MKLELHRQPFDKPQSLMIETLKLLENKNLHELYKETGVGYYWLRKFVAGEFLNPSVNRVQFLYEHLSGVKIKP